MKSLKIILIVLLSTTFAVTKTASAQQYGKMNYWGKETQLDRSFFEILNSNYANWMKNTAKSWKNYDYNDYTEIYGKLVDRLKTSYFTIIVDEANRLSWTGAFILIPGPDGRERPKKSEARVNYILFQVLLPSLQQFEKTRQ